MGVGVWFVCLNRSIQRIDRIAPTSSSAAAAKKSGWCGPLHKTARRTRGSNLDPAVSRCDVPLKSNPPESRIATAVVPLIISYIRSTYFEVQYTCHMIDRLSLFFVFVSSTRTTIAPPRRGSARFRTGSRFFKRSVYMTLYIGSDGKLITAARVQGKNGVCRDDFFVHQSLITAVIPDVSVLFFSHTHTLLSCLSANA